MLHFVPMLVAMNLFLLVFSCLVFVIVFLYDCYFCFQYGDLQGLRDAGGPEQRQAQAGYRQEQQSHAAHGLAERSRHNSE
jgi:hypothetical protein